MKLYYYADTDSLYIDLAERPGVTAKEVVPDVVLDLDGEGRVVGIDIDRASRHVDLPRLEAASVPFQTVSGPSS
ncbi:MAG TPA: DUF2283 domain-containing protein [Gemmatimonadales bacterium]